MAKRRMDRLKGFLKVHLHILLYSYFWLGLFLCGLAAPDARVAELHSRAVTKGWHLSLISVLLILPVPILYWARMARGRTKGTGA